MEEYEYSFKVTDVNCYVEYCVKNGYKLTGENNQNRVVYENKDNRSIIARITTVEKNGEIKKVFDCKNVSQSHANLKISNKTIPMTINENNESEINSLLEVLNFEKVSDLYRNRKVYEKDGVKFEIDDYTKPIMHVVAIEGNRQNVDEIYNELKQTFNNIVEE